MPAIPLTQLGSAYITLTPPWSRKPFTLRRLATPKGVIPERLRPFIPSKGTTPTNALRAVKGGGGISGGNARTQKKYAKGRRPSRTLNQILGE